MNDAAPRVTLTTPRQPGAVALVQLHGEGAAALLHTITDRTDWQAARLHLVNFNGIDQGLAVRLHDQWAQLMPHGGPRVVERLIDRLIALGARYEAQPAPHALYPEADSAIEADALATIARAASPAAIDLLAAQPRLWRSALHSDEAHEPIASLHDPAQRQARLTRSSQLDQLVQPPTVVVIGQPNVGKSTLTNAMLGKSISVVADLPGTTRDWVGGVAELPTTCASDDTGISPNDTAIAVHWLDTPGLRMADETIEQRAIELARDVIHRADVLIAMRDQVTDWPEPADLPRTPDIWAINKMDEPTVTTQPKAQQAAGNGASQEAPLAISAEHDLQLDALARRVLAACKLDTLRRDEPWAFSPTLRQAVTDDTLDMLADYVRNRDVTLESDKLESDKDGPR